MASHKVAGASHATAGEQFSTAACHKEPALCTKSFAKGHALRDPFWHLPGAANERHLLREVLATLHDPNRHNDSTHLRRTSAHGVQELAREGERHLGVSKGDASSFSANPTTKQPILCADLTGPIVFPNSAAVPLQKRWMQTAGSSASSQGRAMLHTAATEGTASPRRRMRFPSALDLFLTASANADPTLLLHLLAQDDGELLLRAVEDRSAMTALHLSARYGHTIVVQLLMERMMDHEVHDRRGRSPLALACHYGHMVVMEQLLKANADPILVDRLGRTSLHYACCGVYCSDTEAAAVGLLLLRSRPDLLSIVDDGGRTAAAYALASQWPVLADLLWFMEDLNLTDRRLLVTELVELYAAPLGSTCNGEAEVACERLGMAVCRQLADVGDMVVCEQPADVGLSLSLPTPRVYRRFRCGWEAHLPTPHLLRAWGRLTLEHIVRSRSRHLRDTLCAVMSLQRAHQSSATVPTSDTAAAAGMKAVVGDIAARGSNVETIRRRWYRLVWMLDLCEAWRDAAKTLSLLRRWKEETQPAKHRPVFLQRPLAGNFAPCAQIQQRPQQLSFSASLHQSPLGLAAEIERAKNGGPQVMARLEALQTRRILDRGRGAFAPPAGNWKPRHVAEKCDGISEGPAGPCRRGSRQPPCWKSVDQRCLRQQLLMCSNSGWSTGNSLRRWGLQPRHSAP